MAKTYDVKCVLFTANEKGKTSHKSIDLESFIECLNKPEIKERLEEGKLLGLLTHDGRSRARQGEIPHHDWVMKDPDLCNITRKVTVKDGVVYGYLDLTDTPAAERFKSLYHQGCKIGVSISTQLIEHPDSFQIVEFFGTDFTLRGEFASAQIVEANFSEASPTTPTNFNSSIQFNVPVDPTEKVILGNFSENPTSTKSAKSDIRILEKDFSSSRKQTPGVKDSDFSLKEMLREHTRQPAINLRTRINEVIRWSKMARVKTFQENRTYLRRYILEYVNEWVLLSLGDSTNDLNIAIGLRLSQYCKDRAPMRSLQMQLKRARASMDKNGYMSREIQLKLNEDFASVMNQIYEYINSKIKSEDKKL